MPFGRNRPVRLALALAILALLAAYGLASWWAARPPPPVAPSRLSLP